MIEVLDINKRTDWEKRLGKGSHKERESDTVDARVDEGVFDLVEAFNSIPGVITQESCQGESGELKTKGGTGRLGYVTFEVRGSSKESLNFVDDWIAPALRSFIDGSSSAYLHADYCSYQKVRFFFAFHNEQILEVTNSILKLSKSLGKLYNWCICGETIKVPKPFSDWEYTCLCGRKYKSCGYTTYQV